MFSAFDEHNGAVTVTVTVTSLSDAAGLQKALRAKGVVAYVDYTPAGKACQQPRGQVMRGQVMPGQGRISGSREQSTGLSTFSIDPGTMKPGESVVIESSGDVAQTSVRVQFVQGPVAACNLVDAPAVPGPGAGGSDTHTVTGVDGGGAGTGPVTSTHTG